MSNSASNSTASKFPVHFVQARRGVRSRDPVAGLKGFQAFPDRDGVQPAVAQTFMCSIKFVLRAKKVVFLTVHEQVDAEQMYGHNQGRGRTEGAGQTHHRPQQLGGRVKAVGADEAIEWARAILSEQDVNNAGILGKIAFSLAAIEALQDELKVPTERLMQESEQTLQIAELLFRARQERELLKRLHGALSSGHLPVLGQGDKQIKADRSNSALAAAELDKLRRGLAQRQGERTKIAANQEPLSDKSGDGLEDILLWIACGLKFRYSPCTAKDNVMQALQDLFAIQARITEGKEQLAALVNRFERRRHLYAE